MPPISALLTADTLGALLFGSVALAVLVLLFGSVALAVLVGEMGVASPRGQSEALMVSNRAVQVGSTCILNESTVKNA